jgi:hypothetical protein
LNRNSGPSSILEGDEKNISSLEALTYVNVEAHDHSKVYDFIIKNKKFMD